MPTMTLTIERTPRTIRFNDQLIHVEELGVRLPFACKPGTLREMCATGEQRIFITSTITMTPAEFDAFASDFSKSRIWLAGEGGSAENGCLCVEVCAPGRPYLYVDPAGGDYARYVARLG